MNRTQFQRLMDEFAGRAVDTTADRAERVEAARLAKARRPRYIVRRLDSLSGGLLYYNQPSNYRLPDNGAPFKMPVYEILSDAMSEAAYFNIVRKYGARGGGTVADSYFTAPKQAALFAGDISPIGYRAAPPENPLPEPIVLEEGEALNLVGSGNPNLVIAGGSVDMSATLFVLKGAHIHPDDSREGRLTEDEREEIEAQVSRARPRFAIAYIDIDMTGGDPSKPFVDVRLPDLGEWATLEGFAMVELAGAYLQWSTVEINDPRGHEWSDNPIPITALCHYPTAVKLLNWRRLAHSYLIAPGERQPLLTFAKRAATGGLFPGVVAADTFGTLAAVYRTL